jgi:hypothetical protein
MLKRKSKTARPSDVNQAAFQMVRQSTGTDVPESSIPIAPRKRAKSAAVSDSEISRVMAAMGRRGGQIGGKRRLTTMTADERREVARKAAQARWTKESESA